MKYIIKIATVLLGFVFLYTSCLNDLDTEPLDPDETTADVVFEEPGAYKAFLAKLYAGLAVSGQDGPAGMADISGIDEGFGQYLRGFWYHQELVTDEAVIGWNDQTIKDFHAHNWGASDNFIAAMYYRIYYQISIANEFLRSTTEEKLDERGESEQTKAEVAQYRHEARFLRALSYWHALDLFGGGVPFIDENDPVGSYMPEPISKENLFAFIESELKAIENDITTVGTNEYGRADQGAVWTLLAKLYLNAEVYINEAKYTEVITYTKKVIEQGPYTLEDNYEHLFLADNGNLSEVIFPIIYDGINIQTYGGTNFIIHAAVGGDIPPSEFGVGGGWGGIRTTKALVNKFDDPSGATDSRAIFYGEDYGQSLEIEDISNFQQGYAIGKFKNVTSAGEQGTSQDYPDTDFPMFRLADVYLMYAEAVVKGGSGGNIGDAVIYVNLIRQRAYGDASGDIDATDLNEPDFILNERARELYWECHRRTDLIRYGKLTGGDYLWPWKGNTQDGVATDDKYNLFPLPSSEVNANTNLSQNPDY